MRTYRRVRQPGGRYCFTVNLAERGGNTLLVERIDALRDAFRRTRVDHPFAVEAMVVLPDHLHCVWRMPPDDADFATRWRLIKSRFSRAIDADERRSPSRVGKGERGVWQRRYWEHLIRDDEDWRRHVDYIHFNPVKHGYVDRASDWPHSTFNTWVARGMYVPEWGRSVALVS